MAATTPILPLPRALQSPCGNYDICYQTREAQFSDSYRSTCTGSYLSYHSNMTIGKDQYEPQSSATRSFRLDVQVFPLAAVPHTRDIGFSVSSAKDRHKGEYIGNHQTLVAEPQTSEPLSPSSLKPLRVFLRCLRVRPRFRTHTCHRHPVILRTMQLRTMNVDHRNPRSPAICLPNISLNPPSVRT